MVSTPKFFDFFKAAYYSNSYLPAVELSDQALSKHLLQGKTGEVAKRLISEPEVKAVLSEPLSYDLAVQVPQKNATLQRHGFNLLSVKPNGLMGELVPFYSVLEHPELPGWIIKSGAARVAEGQILLGAGNDKNEMAFFTKEEGLLRIEMAERISKIAQDSNIEVIIPKKKLVAYSEGETTDDPCRKYCVICEKIDILSAEDTVQTIRDMAPERQKELARKISTLIQKAGLVDASFHNIRLTKEGKLAMIDTEPAGLMVAKKPGLWNVLFGPKGASVEKCARIGLAVLLQQSEELKPFHEEIEKDYKRLLTPQLSKWKIGLSVVSLGLIPLVHAIVALVKTYWTQAVFEKLMAFDKKHQLSLMNKEMSVEEYQKKRAPMSKLFFELTEGAPYSSSPFWDLVNEA